MTPNPTPDDDVVPDAAPNLIVESSTSSHFSRLLDEAGDRADQMIADFRVQVPGTIDLTGRVTWLPGKVLDALIAMKDQLNDVSRAAIADWEEEQTQHHTEMWEQLDQQIPSRRAILDWEESASRSNRELWDQLERNERAFRSSLPPNWNSPEIEFPSLEELKILQLEEGLPLAWVPPNSVLQAILGCSTSASRRRVVAGESAKILTARLSELRGLRSGETKEWRASAREAASAMKTGHWRAGQALAAIALDTATVKFVKSAYKDAVTHSRKGKGGVRLATPPGSSEDSLPTWMDVDYPRALLVLHGIFGAFAEYDENGLTSVPRQFTRHGTVHSVGRPQYNKANAVIALMHLVGLLCLIEDE